MALLYFAWADAGEAFNAAVHATAAQYIWDGTSGGGEKILSLAVGENEGDFPTLTFDLPNPGTGLLGAGRKRWCWLSVDLGAGPQAVFTGRLIGIPQQFGGEVATLQFVARPADWVAQKAALASALRELPWWDPLWLEDSIDDDDAALETRTASWHYHRTTLVVSTSDLVAGEAGTIEIGESQCLYEEFDLSYAETPLRKVEISVTGSWPQTGVGDVDITREVYEALDSPYDYPVIASLTGEGLLSDWPQPQDNIGAGWSFAAATSIAAATHVEELSYVVHYVDKPEAEDTLFQRATQNLAKLMFEGWTQWQAAFPLGAYTISVVVHYDAVRERSETVIAVVEADVQPLLVEPGASEEARIELTSTLVGEPIDAGSPPEIPIGDLRRNSYFKTTRGARSWEYPLLLARAMLIGRARAVLVKFVVAGWAPTLGITCRHSVHLVDRRLPGGEATGKVISYALIVTGDGELRTEVTIGCTIGYGVVHGAAAAGTGVYAQPGYMQPGYQVMTGAESTVITGELLYQSFGEFEVSDDDGLNLLDMTPGHVITSLTVTGTHTQQREAINASLETIVPDPVGALKATPTEINLLLRPVAGGKFGVTFTPTVSTLVIPKTIDLEAA